jgi:MOSC domain-containing protein YiiM
MQLLPQMRLVSVNVGLPCEVRWKGRTVLTGIFKEPVSGRVAVHRLNLEGDRQADLTVHGGLEKAIYVYPAEYYTYWRKEFPDMELPFGMFGENFTVEGLDERVNIGDQFNLGTIKVMVIQPRLPCYKLGLKFKRDDILKRFLNSGLTGFYLSVLEEGEVEAGNIITCIKHDENGITVEDITQLYAFDRHNMTMLQRVVALEALPESWRAYFQDRLEKHSSQYV